MVCHVGGEGYLDFRLYPCVVAEQSLQGCDGYAGAEWLAGVARCAVNWYRFHCVVSVYWNKKIRLT